MRVVLVPPVIVCCTPARLQSYVQKLLSSTPILAEPELNRPREAASRTANDLQDPKIKARLVTSNGLRQDLDIPLIG